MKDAVLDGPRVADAGAEAVFRPQLVQGHPGGEEFQVRCRDQLLPRTPLRQHGTVPVPHHHAQERSLEHGIFRNPVYILLQRRLGPGSRTQENG